MNRPGVFAEPDVQKLDVEEWGNSTPVFDDKSLMTYHCPQESSITLFWSFCTQ
jgi:hypothetical protein